MTELCDKKNYTSMYVNVLSLDDWLDIKVAAKVTLKFNRYPCKSQSWFNSSIFYPTVCLCLVNGKKESKKVVKFIFWSFVSCYFRVCGFLRCYMSWVCVCVCLIEIDWMEKEGRVIFLHDCMTIICVILENIFFFIRKQKTQKSLSK